MNRHQIRYELYKKRSILQAKMNALDEEIMEIERRDRYYENGDDTAFSSAWRELDG